jgi:hypothetical protein
MAIDFVKGYVAEKSGNVVTPKARMSFVSLHEPRKNDKRPTAKPKYEISLLIPPTADLGLLQAAAEKAAKDKWGDKLPKKLRSPFLKAGDYDYAGYEDGWTLIRVSTTTKPQVVNAAGQNVDTSDTSEIYSGRWCMASLGVYTTEPTKDAPEIQNGVSFGLRNVQLFDHDEPLAGGSAKAEDEFQSVGGSAFGDSSGGSDGAASGGESGGKSIFG